MVERIPIYAEPDPANPGQADLKEVGEGESIKGTLPSSVVAANAVVGGNSAGIPTAIPVSPSSLFGRLATGGLVSVGLSGLMAILNALASSAGAAHAGRLVKLGTTGKLSSTMLEQAILDAEENQGASIGITIPLEGDHGHIFAGKDDEVLLFRGIMTESPGSIVIHERPTDVAVSIIFSDKEVADNKLWSSEKIDTELAALDVAIQAISAQTELSSDTTPTLGGDLDIGSFRIMVDVGGPKEAEIMSVDNTGVAPILKFLGSAAVLAKLTNLLDGDQLKYDAAAGDFVNFTPTPSGVDLFAVISTSDKAFIQNTASPLKLASTQPSVDSDNWEQAGSSGSSFTDCKYVGAAERWYRIRYEATLEQTVTNEEATVRFVVRRSSDGSTYSDVLGSSRSAQISHKGSISVEVVELMQPNEYIQLEVLHETGGAASVKSLAYACSVHIESFALESA